MFTILSSFGNPNIRNAKNICRCRAANQISQGSHNPMIIEDLLAPPSALIGPISGARKNLKAASLFIRRVQCHSGYTSFGAIQPVDSTVARPAILKSESLNTTIPRTFIPAQRKYSLGHGGLYGMLNARTGLKPSALKGRSRIAGLSVS